MTLQRQIDGIAIGLAAIPIIAAILLWPVLPAEMAIHWSGGSPDTFVAKPLATLGLFAFAVGTIVFVRVAPDWITNTPGGESLSVLFLGVVFAWVETIVLAWNRGLRFSVELALVPILVLAVGLLGYAFWWR
ncbi:DUF1648 domain-containing protein [Halodesulfurarchaeum sp.]|uniref:DUF1648 domain-containing protein n=1 Tax=Halodesulfurarchaeum sp. TaxID=1980530 RepID=UPI002FC37182